MLRERPRNNFLFFGTACKVWCRCFSFLKQSRLCHKSSLESEYGLLLYSVFRILRIQRFMLRGSDVPKLEYKTLLKFFLTTCITNGGKLVFHFAAQEGYNLV